MNDEQRWCYPVAAAKDLGASPLPVTLFDEDLVLWRDETGTPHAFTDRCPHRGTRLSLGAVRVVDGRAQLECPYHGWRFDGGGRCLHIPALPDFMPAAGHAARSHPLREANGLLWVVPDGDADATACLPDPGPVPGRAVVCGPYDVATSAPRVVENFLDTSHFAFVHEGWLGDRGHTEVPAYDVVLGADGAPGVPHYRAWQPQASAQSATGAWVDYRYQVLSPCSALLVKQVGDDALATQEAYALWVVPLEPERSRVWFTLFTGDAATPDATLRAFQHGIFTQDRPVLESQRPRRLPLSGGEAHCAADRLSAAYRRYLQAQGFTYGTC
ncbi:Rieske 2Fe-2S domain-containing protein [Methylibium sp.]|uniref:aromatic ring-hydroxylating dioxygenase subunit alpha n=1 Tax=Methylibium sp. TaxID=2067992 RepID=UPI003BABE203